MQSAEEPEQATPLPPAAELYAESFGWPISIEAGRVTVSCGDVVDVTTMPSQFAQNVNDLLRLAILSAPILEVAATADKPTTWAFLSSPRLPTSTDDQLVKLSRFDVKHFGAGEKFPLPPSPTCGDHGITWVFPPPYGALKRTLPPWESILACALKVKYTQSTTASVV